MKQRNSNVVIFLLQKLITASKHAASSQFHIVKREEIASTCPPSRHYLYMR